MPNRQKIVKKNNKIRIKIICDFWTSSEAVNVMKNVFLKGENNYSEFIDFVDDNSFTHIIVICGCSSILNFEKLKSMGVSKEKVIAFSNEPNYLLNINENYINLVEKYCSKYFIGIKENHFPDTFKTYYPFLCHPWVRDEYFKNITPKKKFFMSFPYSGATELEGHKYRKKLIEAILETDLDIHIWGKGCHLFKKDKRLKGIFKETHGNVIEDYEFIIHTENSKSDDYISDKLPACIAFNTIPLYWGAKNIEKYFGENSCIRLSGNIEEDMNLLKNIFENPDKYRLNLSIARKELFTGKAYFMKFLYNSWVINNKEFLNDINLLKSPY